MGAPNQTNKNGNLNSQNYTELENALNDFINTLEKAFRISSDDTNTITVTSTTTTPTSSNTNSVSSNSSTNSSSTNSQTQEGIESELKA